MSNIRGRKFVLLCTNKDQAINTEIFTYIEGWSHQAVQQQKSYVLQVNFAVFYESAFETAQSRFNPFGIRESCS